MILQRVRQKRGMQLFLGAAVGIVFGFLLQRDQVTKYDIIVGQLLLRDFTVMKIMLTAIITGMLGIFFLSRLGLVNYHIKTGSLGATIPGGLLFGAGMALLGYCPGTNAGAVGQGALDALIGGVPGIIVGCVFYAIIYPRLEKDTLSFGKFGCATLPELFHTSAPRVMAGLWMAAVTLLFVLEVAGF
jgi:hypothetical protein